MHALNKLYLVLKNVVKKRGDETRQPGVAIADVMIECSGVTSR
jgi:hypothetical protein